MSIKYFYVYLFILFFCVWMFGLHAYLCTIGMLCSKKSERASPKTGGVTESWEPPSGYWE